MSALDGQLSFNGRPMSMAALDFASTLDDIFNLGAIGELKDSVEQRKTKLSDLDAQLRQADEQLKRLEIKHKRMSRHFFGRQGVDSLIFTNDNAQSSASDTDEATSPHSDSSETHQDRIVPVLQLQQQEQEQGQTHGQDQQEH